jgi:hypothetical protein
MRNLKAKTGLPCNPHTFRRIFARLSRKAGVDCLTIKNLGRWESVQMVERYTRSFGFQDAMKFYRGPLTGSRPFYRFLRYVLISGLVEASLDNTCSRSDVGAVLKDLNAINCRLKGQVRQTSVLVILLSSPIDGMIAVYVLPRTAAGMPRIAAGILSWGTLSQNQDNPIKGPRNNVIHIKSTGNRYSPRVIRTRQPRGTVRMTWTGTTTKSKASMTEATILFAHMEAPLVSVHTPLRVVLP